MALLPSLRLGEDPVFPYRTRCRDLALFGAATADHFERRVELLSNRLVTETEKLENMELACSARRRSRALPSSSGE